MEDIKNGSGRCYTFTPVSDFTMDEYVELTNEVGKEIGSLGVPSLLIWRCCYKIWKDKNLAKVRKGQYERILWKNKRGWMETRLWSTKKWMQRVDVQL